MDGIYEKYYRLRQDENIEKVIEDLDNNDSKLNYKIERKSERCGSDIDFIKEEIRRSPVVREEFAKDPSRQNVYEICFNSIIEESGYGIKKLHGTYLIEGKPIKANKPRSGQKSIDFLVTVNNTKIYISHKYIREAGGAQDSQFSDLLDYMDRGVFAEDKNDYYVVVFGGGYFTPQKREILHSKENDRVLAFDAEEFIKFLGGIDGKDIEEITTLINHLSSTSFM